MFTRSLSVLAASLYQESGCSNYFKLAKLAKFRKFRRLQIVTKGLFPTRVANLARIKQIYICSNKNKTFHNPVLTCGFELTRNLLFMASTTQFNVKLPN